MSNKLNIEVKQGEDFYRLITIKNAALVPTNLTGYTFTGQIRAKFGAILFLSFVFTLKNQTTNPGEVEMTLAGSVSTIKKITSRLNYYYDVEMNDGATTTRIMQGNCAIDPEVSK